MSLKAAVPTIARSAPARSASRTFSTVRRPPPYWIGMPVSATIRRRWSSDLRRAGAGAVEVDDVQEARAGLDPGAGGVERVGVVGRGVLEDALDQADRLAVHDVDRGVEDHACATAANWAKLRSMRSPSREDFSGWNWAAITLPRSTIEAKRSPYSLRPTTSLASAGRQAKECTW